jgi:hypothetical protein
MPENIFRFPFFRDISIAEEKHTMGASIATALLFALNNLFLA